MADTPHIEMTESAENRRSDEFTSLGGMPVAITLCPTLAACASAAVKRIVKPSPSVTLIASDYSGLDVSSNGRIAQAVHAGLFDSHITAGNAYGGAARCANIYSALVYSKQNTDCGAVVVSPVEMPPKSYAKYGTPYAWVSEVANAVAALGGVPILAADFDFSGGAARVSSGLLTCLTELAFAKCTVVFPMMDQMQLAGCQEQLNRTSVVYRHHVRVHDARPGIISLQEKGFTLECGDMDYATTPLLFDSASAQGAEAAHLLRKPTHS